MGLEGAEEVPGRPDLPCAHVPISGRVPVDRMLLARAGRIRASFSGTSFRARSGSPRPSSSCGYRRFRGLLDDPFACPEDHASDAETTRRFPTAILRPRRSKVANNRVSGAWASTRCGRASKAAAKASKAQKAPTKAGRPPGRSGRLSAHPARPARAPARTAPGGRPCGRRAPSCCRRSAW